MNGYTVTITPTGKQAGPQTTIHVDTTTGAARVVELTMTAADGNGLAPHQLPVIDLAGLITALTPDATVPAITITDATLTEAPTPPPRRGRRTRSAATTEKTPRKTAGRGRRRRSGDNDDAKPARAYRRMPDQDDVITTWNQTHSASQVADHFDVPRHTATGWLRRLRTMGAIDAA